MGVSELDLLRLPSRAVYNGIGTKNNLLNPAITYFAQYVFGFVSGRVRQRLPFPSDPLRGVRVSASGVARGGPKHRPRTLHFLKTWDVPCKCMDS